MRKTPSLSTLALTALLSVVPGERHGEKNELSIQQEQITEQVKEVQATEVIVEETEQIPSTFALGEITFSIGPDSTELSSKEKIELFKNLESAYKALVDYFGIELMQYPESIRLPITVTLNAGGEGGEILWKNYSRDIEHNPCEVTKTEPYGFHITSLSVDLLAHELVHLYLQRGLLESNAFSEAQTHALIALLFKDPSSWKANRDRELEINLPAYQKVINRPFDYAQCHEVIPETDDLTGNLDMLIRTKEAVLWLDFLKDNPNFIKEFYKTLELRRSKKEKPFFTQEELIEISSSINPNFQAWYDANPILHPIQEGGESYAYQWTKLADDRIGIMNFKIEEDDEGNMKIRRFNTEDATTLNVTFKNGRVLSSSFRTKNIAFESLKLPSPILNHPQVSEVQIIQGKDSIPQAE